MPTIRGFIERLEVGRAGLVTASVLADDASVADYVIRDLDADPERFNERLSKVGILRDAMNRAEPVEIEYTQEGATRLIDRVARITRDVLAGTAGTQRVPAFVVGVSVVAQNRTGNRVESGDRAAVAVLSNAGALATYMLDLQIPERAVAMAQLEMIAAAQENGQPLTLVVESNSQRIVGVELGDPASIHNGGEIEPVDGFVESITVAPGFAPMGNFAIVAFTTAPAFAGAGNVIELKPFLPALRLFLVVQGSLEYDLFVAGLRDKLRMRVVAGPEVQRAGRKTDEKSAPQNADVQIRTFASAAAGADGADKTAVKGASDSAEEVKAYSIGVSKLTLVRGAELLVALASASRPVWIEISRQSLDKGPEGDNCVEGLPSSDLRAKGLRDLDIPYTAEWVGLGCFNHGVYRLQFELGVAFEVSIDGKVLCVHASADGKTRFAHGCLDGEHVVRVVLQKWTCSEVFRMDVYRIR